MSRVDLNKFTPAIAEMPSFAFSITCCLTVLAGGVSQTALRHSHKGRSEGFVKALEFKHRLRVCNAYPYDQPLDVYRGRSEKLTEEAMPYKTCFDFATPLHAGDKLAFKVGDANAGTFAISDLPNNDAVLLLVIHRHDTLSTAVSFESHVFANLLNAQIAIIDTYKGTQRSVASIRDEASKNKQRKETLRYNSVVAVNPGKYQVVLSTPEGEAEMTSELVALNRESYVILRTGVEAQSGPSYDEELVVYPKSDPAFLFTGARSGASTVLPMKLIATILGFAMFSSA